MGAPVQFRWALVFTASTILWSQQAAPAGGACSCGRNPPGAPANREQRPYAGAPQDLRPFSRYTAPYFEHYSKLVEYNGAARDVPVPALDSVKEVRIGFLGPVENHPDEALGKMMLNGVNMAIAEANARGGYCGKPFRLMVHNDQAVWGASSNEVVKMVYDDQVWAIFGSISGDSTHIALRVALKAEVPIVNSAATDPTIPETIIPWYLTVIQDDRVQGYTLARRIYSDLGLKRVAILRVNDRYGRFGVGKFKDASRRLGHPVVIEQKYLYGDRDFSHQLANIEDSRVDAIVLWGDAGPAGNILKQMRAREMKQRVFGSFRVLGDPLLANAGSAAEGLEVVFPYDAGRTGDAVWDAFKARFAERYSNATPDSFASLGYDGMKILLDAICRAGLNRGRIRDVLTGLERYNGVTGAMMFDPNAKNIAPLWLGVVEGGKVHFRRYTMDKPYAQVGEKPVEYNGPRPESLPADGVKPVIALFGPRADSLAATLSAGGSYSVAGVDSETAWGKAVNELVRVLYDPHTLGIVATDRKAAHLALQLANKVELPVLAITSDTTLTGINIPWIFRLPEGTPPARAVALLGEAAGQAGKPPNRGELRRILASGRPLSPKGEGAAAAAVRFASTGEPVR
jgi:branched-chain amino acid transport system substrate-binding protein